MNTKHWMTSGIMGTALTLSSTLAWGALVAQQSTSDPTTLILAGGATLPATSITNVTAQPLPANGYAAQYTATNSSMTFLGAGDTALINPDNGMTMMWVQIGASWIDNSHPNFLIGQGNNHWNVNSFSLFRDTSDNQMHFRIIADNGAQINAQAALPGGLKAGDWLFVAASWTHYSKEKLNLYLGTDSLTVSDSGNTYFYDNRLNYEYWPTTAQTTLHLGASVTGGEPWAADGSIYNFALYNSRTDTDAAAVIANAFAAKPIPEPAALGLLTLGAGLAAARRRR